MTAGIFTAQRHAEGDSYRAVVPTDAEYPNALEAWEATRAKPYAFAAAGAIALTSGAMGLLLKAPNRRFTLIGASISAAAGVALAAWGTVDVLRGAACGASAPQRQTCSADLELRDRGAVLLLSAFPLLAAPIALLFRNWLGKPQASTVAFWSGFDPKERSILFNVRSVWL